MYEKLAALGVAVQGKEVLDLGSGTAVLPISLYETGAHFTATDISENQISFGRENALKKGFDKIDFKVCGAEDTGFESDRFDAVTAVQCFHYFNAEKAAGEIFRVLKPCGLFCKIFMDWLPGEDEKIAEMEAFVLRYNPGWSGCGFQSFEYSYPRWARNRFIIDTIHSYDENLEFTREAWLGRIMSCRGVGASLSEEKAAEFETEYRSILEKYPEPLRLKHQIHIELYRSVKDRQQTTTGGDIYGDHHKTSKP